MTAEWPVGRRARARAAGAAARLLPLACSPLSSLKSQFVLSRRVPLPLFLLAWPARRGCEQCRASCRSGACAWERISVTALRRMRLRWPTERVALATSEATEGCALAVMRARIDVRASGAAHASLAE